MRTITFYSYKGGTGRTLLLANVAKFLAWNGKKVAVLDFDLEAPGLHYKFALGSTADGDGRLAVDRGLIDYLLAWQEKGDEPEEKVSEYFKKISLDVRYPGEIHFLPAGNAPSVQYVDKLVRLDWWQLLYKEDDKPLSQRLGARVFAKVKEFAQIDLGTDFLLIDSRTGMTDIGGVALNVLADCVVCTMLSNQENIDGIREVIRNLEYKNASGQAPVVEYLVLLSRCQESARFHDDQERQTVGKLSDKLFKTLPTTIRGSQGLIGLEVLHSDRNLEFEELLRFDGTYTPNESLLIRDYFRVFRLLHLLDDVPPHNARIAKIIADAPSYADSRVSRDTSPDKMETVFADRIARGHRADWPVDPWPSVFERLESRKPPALVYLPPNAHRTSYGRFSNLRRFMKSVAERVGEEVSGKLLEKEVLDFTWSRFVAPGMLDGEFEICGEPLDLTWIRSHLVGIVQFGWMRYFSLMVGAESPLVETLHPILNEIAAYAKHAKGKGDGQAMIARVIRSLLERQVNFQVGVVGESAASAECMRHLTALLDPKALQRKGSEQDLRDWLANKSDVALAVCDMILADDVAQRFDRECMDAKNSQDKILLSEDASPARKLRYGRIDPSYILSFLHPIPVGIPYPIEDHRWRRTIAKAFLNVLVESAKDWGTKNTKGNVSEELQAVGIDPMDAEDLKKRLLLDLNLSDAVCYIEGAMP